MGSFGTEFRFRDEETGGLTGEYIPIDFAKSAEAYGVKAYRVNTAQQLQAALEDAAGQSRSTLIDIKTLPKTMTHDYESWWHVGVAEEAEKPSVQDAYSQLQSRLDSALKY